MQIDLVKQIKGPEYMVHWSLNQNDTDLIKARCRYEGVKEFNAQSVLVYVIKFLENGEMKVEGKKVFSLKSMSGRIRFTSSGSHVIVAFVMSESEANSYCQDRSSNFYFLFDVYGLMVKSRNQRDNMSTEEKIRCCLASRLEDFEMYDFAVVDVKENCFVSKPWDYGFVNAWFKNPPTGSIAFNFRRLLYYLFIMPWWLPLRTSAVSLLMILSLCLGLRNINWSVINPFGNFKVFDVFSEMNRIDSIFIFDRVGGKHYWRIALCPFIALPLLYLLGLSLGILSILTLMLIGTYIDFRIIIPGYFQKELKPRVLELFSSMNRYIKLKLARRERKERRAMQHTLMNLTLPDTEMPEPSRSENKFLSKFRQYYDQ